MQISTSSAAYRSYMWWLERSYSGLARELTQGRRTLTLCSLFWIVTLRAPAIRFEEAMERLPAWLQAVLLFEVVVWGTGLAARALSSEPFSLIEIGLNVHAVLLAAVLLLALVLALLFAVGTVHKYVQRRESAWGELVPAWVRAKKQRVCPLVTFEDEHP